MKKVKKWWIALLLGALLMATVVGVVWARPKASPAYKLTIPVAHFHPRQDGYDWMNDGHYMAMNSGSGLFYAALPIALPGRFTVEKLTLFAYDSNASQGVCAYLYRMNPWTASQEQMGSVCTTGESYALQRPSTTTFDPDTIYGGHGGYIKLWFPSSTGLQAHAVQIEYH